MWGAPSSADAYAMQLCKQGLADRNAGIAQAFPLHQGEQNGGIGGMQPDAAAGRRSAELRDVRRAVDGEMAS